MAEAGKNATNATKASPDVSGGITGIPEINTDNIGKTVGAAAAAAAMAENTAHHVGLAAAELVPILAPQPQEGDSAQTKKDETTAFGFAVLGAVAGVASLFALIGAVHFGSRADESRARDHAERGE